VAQQRGARRSVARVLRRAAPAQKGFGFITPDDGAVLR
jgi:hypothetical protein